MVLKIGGFLAPIVALNQLKIKLLHMLHIKLNQTNALFYVCREISRSLI